MRLRLRYMILLWLVLVSIASVVFAYKNMQRLENEGWSFLNYPTRGTQVGAFEGEPIYAAGGNSVRGEYGLEFECVELINRFYTKKLGHQNLTRTGDADSYYWEAAKKGLKAYPNGGSEPPQKYDFLIFDGGNGDGDPGHIALVTEVDLAGETVTFVQQNARKTTFHRLFVQFNWQDSLRITKTMGSWFIDQGHYPQPVAGWSRRQESP